MPTQKYADYGLFAQTGVIAAYQAEAGMSSHPALLDGGWGLWRLRGASACDFGTMLADLGDRWYVLDNTYKPWPSCRFVHHTLTLVERLLRERDIDASSIERVDVFSHLYGIAPYFRAQNPEGMVSCEFNHSHGVAMLALDVPPGPWWYAPATLRDPGVDAIRRRVFVQLDERSLNAEQWFVDGQIRALPSRVAIGVRGRVFEGETDFALGDPWSPETRMTDARFRDKFLHMGSRLGPADRAWASHAQRIFDMVGRLEAVEHVSDLTAFLRPGSLPLDLSTWKAAA
jgi:2-methylcitrate dehydratase PrpD